MPLHHANIINRDANLSFQRVKICSYCVKVRLLLAPLLVHDVTFSKWFVNNLLHPVNPKWPGVDSSYTLCEFLLTLCLLVSSMMSILHYMVSNILYMITLNLYFMWTSQIHYVINALYVVFITMPRCQLFSPLCVQFNCVMSWYKYIQSTFI